MLLLATGSFCLVIIFQTCNAAFNHRVTKTHEGQHILMHLLTRTNTTYMLMLEMLFLQAAAVLFKAVRMFLFLLFFLWMEPNGNTASRTTITHTHTALVSEQRAVARDEMATCLLHTNTHIHSVSYTWI